MGRISQGLRRAPDNVIMSMKRHDGDQRQRHLDELHEARLRLVAGVRDLDALDGQLRLNTGTGGR